MRYQENIYEATNLDYSKEEKTFEIIDLIQQQTCNATVTAQVKLSFYKL